MESTPEPDRTRAIADRLAAAVETSSRSARVVELAVGRRPGVAAALVDRRFDVLATDVRERTVPDGVGFALDDLTDPDRSYYEGAAVLYARNLPAELQRPARDLAAAVDAPLFFTTLGAEYPVIAVERETLSGTTLYRPSDGPNASPGPR